MLQQVFPKAPSSTYPSFISIIKSIIWSCSLESFNYFSLIIEFCGKYLQFNPFQYYSLFRLFSDFIGVNSENSDVKNMLEQGSAKEFLTLALRMTENEPDLERFCDTLPDLLVLMATLMLFCTGQMLEDSLSFLDFIQKLSKCYQHFNNAEIKSSILIFWNTCLTLEPLYRTNEHLQTSIETMLATPLACMRYLPSMSLTHTISKLYITTLLRPYGRRNQLQTPREMERERSVVEQGVNTGVCRIRDLSETDQKIVVSRLLGCRDVRMDNKGKKY